MPKYWLLKSEPSVFSFQDLLKAPKQTSSWEGVRNYQARNFMRDEFKIGDRVIFYHSSCDVPAAMGTAEVVRAGYPDEHAMNSKHKYFDSEAKKKGVNPWFMVDVKAVKEFKRPVTRELMKKEPRLNKVMVLQKGSRLSVQPLLPKEFEAICELGNSVTIQHS